MKTLLMFLPLVIGFVLLAVIVNDLKHPLVQHESCRLIGRGAAVQAFKSSARMLFKEGTNMANDIGFNCPAKGNLLVNQTVPLPLKPKQTIDLETKHYHYLPERYYLFLNVVNPKQD